MLTLMAVGGGHRLEPTTARQFRLWNWAHHVRFGYDFDVNWSTRDSSQQISMLTKYYRRTSKRTGLYWDGSYWEKKPGSTTTVAKPGTSPHENGRALDFEWKSATEREWAHNTASIYGFAFNVRGENWHAAQIGGARITSGNERALSAFAQSAPSTPPSTPKPVPVPEEEEDEDMTVKIVIDPTNNRQYALGPRGEHHLVNGQEIYLGRYLRSKPDEMQGLSQAERDIVRGILAKVE